MKTDAEIKEEGRKAALAWYSDKGYDSTNPYEDDRKYDLWEDGWKMGVIQYMNGRKTK